MTTVCCAVAGAGNAAAAAMLAAATRGVIFIILPQITVFSHLPERRAARVSGSIYEPREARLQASRPVALRMRFDTSTGCDSKDTWLEAISTIVAFIRFAMKRWSPVSITRSLLEIA